LLALCHLFWDHFTNITPAAGTVSRKSGRRKRKKWAGATQITLNPLSLCTGGTSDENCLHEVETSLTEPEPSDGSVEEEDGKADDYQHHGSNNLSNCGHCIEVKLSDLEEDEFLQYVMQVCVEDSDVNNVFDPRCSININSNNPFSTSTDTFNNPFNTSADAFINNDSNPFNSTDAFLNNNNNGNNNNNINNNNNLELYDFKLKDGEHMVLSWKGVKCLSRLYINIPGELLPPGSRECFVSLLEYAEEVLKVDTMYLCMRKDRPDRANLLRIFMFLGFEIVFGGACPQVPRSEKFLFMGYSFD